MEDDGSPCDQLQDHDAEAVDVTLCRRFTCSIVPAYFDCMNKLSDKRERKHRDLVTGFGIDVLWINISGCANNDERVCGLRASVVVERLGQAEIGDLGLQFFIQQDVSCLHIPVNERWIAALV